MKSSQIVESFMTKNLCSSQITDDLNFLTKILKSSQNSRYSMTILTSVIIIFVTNTHFSCSDLGGVKLANNTLDATSPRATLSPTQTVRRTATKPGADVMPVALHHLYKLEDTAEAGLRGPYVLLLCPLS